MLTGSRLYPQCLPHNKCSINICCLNEMVFCSRHLLISLCPWVAGEPTSRDDTAERVSTRGTRQPAQPSASLATCPADPALSGWRPTSQGLTVSLVPPMGDGDVMQVVTDSLHDFVGFVRVVICGDTELVQSLGVDSQHVGDESVDSSSKPPEQPPGL